MKFIHYFVTLLTVILIFVAPATAQAPPSAQQIAQDASPHGVTVDEVALQSALDDLFKSLGNANAAQPTSVSVDNSSLTLASGASTKRLKCPHNGGSQLVVYAWADVSLNHSGFSQIHDKGYYYVDLSTLLNMTIDGATSAYIQDNNQSVLVRFSGTMQLYTFTGLWIGSYPLNFSCKFVLSVVIG